MTAQRLWEIVFKLQNIQESKKNDLLYREFAVCKYSKCNNKKVIQIYNKDEWTTEFICKKCFIQDWGKTDYTVVLPTLYDEYEYVDSIFEKYGVDNEY